ncbi:MAG TPA: hypothetical protein VJ046_02670 [Candidatus Paceibacterota bacterium]|nr:hypothetical protein [Candidatus Paceibacterota bacterium]
MGNGSEIVRKPLDVGKAFKYRLQGLSYREIGELLGGYADSTVCDALQGFKKLLDNPHVLTAYRDNQTELLEALNSKIISTLPDDLDIKKGKGKLSGYQKVGMFGLIFDKIRLLRGQSTVNLNSLSALVISAAKDFARGKEVDVSPNLPPNEAVVIRSEVNPTSDKD